MLADIMPNILALAPYESVFGLACSCRALSRKPVERAQYEISVPFRIGTVIGTMTRYTNGWHIGARIADSTRVPPSTIDVVYKNNVPFAAHRVASSGSGTWIMSLATRTYCVIADDAIYIPGGSGWHNAYVAVGKDSVGHSDAVDDRVAQAIADVMRPLLFVPPGITADTIRVVVKAMNIYARHIGSRTESIFARPAERALKALVAGYI